MSENSNKPVSIVEISLVNRCFPFNVVAEENTYKYGPQGTYRDTHPSALRVMEPCRPSYVLHHLDNWDALTFFLVERRSAK